MAIKLSEKLTKDLKCLFGGCTHDPWNKDCPFNQVVDKADPAEASLKLALKWIRREIELYEQRKK